MGSTAIGALFVTSPFIRSGRLGEGPACAPGAVVHAKSMGTNVTLCGQSTYTWVKLWDVPFAQVHGSRCGACVDALIGRSKAVR